MVSYLPRSLILVKTLFLIAFLSTNSLMAMEEAEDRKGGHTTINVKAQKQKPKKLNFKERSQRITDLEGKCEAFNKRETSALYRKSKDITDFLTKENKVSVSRGFRATMGYLKTLLSKDSATFQRMWTAITGDMDAALKSPDPVLTLLELNKSMRKALGIKAPKKTKKVPSSSKAVAVTVAVPVVAIPPQECCGGYSACCKAGGCGFRAWSRVMACVTWCKSIKLPCR